MRVAERRVGDEQPLLLADPGGELLRAEPAEQVARAFGVCFGSRRRDDGPARRRPAGGQPGGGFDGAVDDDLADVGEQFRRAVLPAREVEQLGRLVDEARRHAVIEERPVRDEVDEERHVRLDAAHAELLQRAHHASGGVGELQALRRDLDEERVVEGRDDRAGERAAVEADAHAAGRAVVEQFAVVGQEVARGVFGGDAALEGEAGRADGGLIAEADRGVAQRKPLGDEDLAVDDIDARDLLGDGVFDLDTRVDLDEEELAALDIDEEFGRGGVVEANGLPDGEGGGEDAVAEGRIEIRRGGDLDDFLVAALDGAVALEQMDEVAVLVAEELDLDVAGVRDEALEEHIADTEGATGLAAGLVEGVVELFRRLGNAHAAPAAAHGGLDDDGVAELRGDAVGLLVGGDGLATGEDRNACRIGEAAGDGLVAELFEDVRARADEDDAGGADGPRELGPLGEEAVARMDGVDVVIDREGDEGGDVEVGADRLAGFARLIRLVGLEAVQGETVLVRVDRDRADVQLVGRAEDADRDLAPVGDHELAQRPGGGRLGHTASLQRAERSH